MVKINVISDIFSNTGYSSHTRGLINGLFEVNPETSLVCNLPNDWEKKVNDDELKMIKKGYRSGETDIVIGMPHHFKIHINSRKKHKFIGYCVWEGTHVPKFWEKDLENKEVNLIFVPSTHTRDAIINTFPNNKNIIDKIRVINHGVNTDLFKPEENE